MSEKEKKAFALRLNPALLKELEKWAADEFRSVNGQLEYILHRAVQQRKRSSGRIAAKDRTLPGEGAGEPVSGQSGDSPDTGNL